jgi:hypothetical protein
MSRDKSQTELAGLLRDRDRLQIEMQALIRQELGNLDNHEQVRSAIDAWNTLQAELYDLEKLIAHVKIQREQDMMYQNEITTRQWSER